jgi:type IV pilus assembly protein PilO
MTVAEDFVPGAEQGAETPEYPVAFGITFTPIVSFALLALVGVAGAAYMGLNIVKPAYDEYQSLQAKRDSTQATLDQKKGANSDQVIIGLQNQIAQQKARQPVILSLFSSDRTVDTLLFDFQKIFQAEKVVIKTYEPTGLVPEVVTDGSFGDLVNNKLKRRTINIEFEATVPQTQAIIKRLEQFQSLIVIKDFNAEINQMPTLVFDKGKINPKGSVTLNVKFVADVLYPISSTEQAQLAQEAAKGEQQPPQ